MSEHSICPWWAGYLFLGPTRRLFQNPAEILAPYIQPGMVVLEPGPGMGFFTLEIARRVGPGGRVVTIEVQPRMNAVLQRRARKAGVSDRVDARCVTATGMEVDDLTEQVDLVFAFAVVHEMPSSARFFGEAAHTLRPGGRLLLVEPAGHVDDAFFAAQLAAGEGAGLEVVERPQIRKSQAALFRRAAP